MEEKQQKIARQLKERRDPQSKGQFDQHDFDIELVDIEEIKFDLTGKNKITGELDQPRFTICIYSQTSDFTL